MRTLSSPTTGIESTSLAIPALPGGYPAYALSETQVATVLDLVCRGASEAGACIQPLALDLLEFQPGRAPSQSLATVVPGLLAQEPGATRGRPLGQPRRPTESRNQGQSGKVAPNGS